MEEIGHHHHTIKIW